MDVDAHSPNSQPPSDVDAELENPTRFTTQAQAGSGEAVGDFQVDSTSDSTPAPPDHRANSTAKSSSAATSTNVTFPISRVRRIIKEDPDITICQADAVHAIAVAAQIFAQELAKSGQQMAQEGKRKTLAYKDLAKAVSETERMEFLSDLIPPMVPLKKALERSKQDAKTTAL
ncbi:hypothetical protein H4R33_003466 [Dimargaris cristalligena]|uniref:Histone-fold-containing protein n=1 Tax=Dimargaris cristalligena TaxID=215637 RepID=A0A4P9ZST1_9FUNG|nr:hypothetical protein H4R33_003466 [Dimargaris cristalligena]RKP36636.1 histone-fold-containing protein [Dimargaris cristalligena]|eukprot:RKP36636.1 histone-fold-containing protein [Dimargaris cristalligena]